MVKEREYEHACREALAAVAMAFAPATNIPRERALVKAAITLILLNFGNNTFKRGQAIKTICDHGNLPELRDNLAESLFDNLISSDIIRPQSKGDDPDYRFEESFSQKINAEQNHVDNLIEQVLRDLFDNTNFPQDMMPQLRKEMLLAISHLMEAYGKQYAYQVAGRVDKPIVVQYNELLNICKSSISKKMAQYIKSTDMAGAIAELFKQKEEHFAAFVFALTQNYYYLRLLGLGGGLEALSEERFKGSTFFIDTNLLFPFLFEESRHHRSILELMDIVQQLDISLHETEITLDELRTVINHHRNVFAKVYDEVPEGLVATTNNILLSAYRRQKGRKPDLKPEEFLSEFLDVRKRLENEWGITVFDDPIEYSINPKEIAHTRKIINESSIKIRHGISKGDLSQEHDSHLYYVILAERKRSGENSAWLLTLDTSLFYAAKQLQPEEATPFCMTLDGFLHIISPYIRADHQKSFSDVFVELVGNNLFPFEETIRIDDFLMFTDFDLSIRNLPPEDVKKVIRHVKRQLDGGIPSPDSQAKVAYEVQKALSDPTLKYRTTLEEEIKRRDYMIEQILEERKIDQQKSELEIQKIETCHKSQFTELNLKLNEMDRKNKEDSSQITCLIKRLERNRYFLKVLFSFVLCGSIGIGIWFLPQRYLVFTQKVLLFKMTLSAIALFGFLCILVRTKMTVAILIILSVLSALFCGWVAFFN